MNERLGIVTLHGKAITLLGDQLRIDSPAPDFKAVDKGFKAVSLSDFKGKICLISVVPSLDTPVCSVQTKRFNAEVASLSDELQIITISRDLPFAQSRFCEAEGIDKLLVLSDSVWHEFGEKYGVLIKDMGLLARSVFIIDKNGKLIYQEIVPEISSHPDYAKAQLALSAVLS